LKAETTLALRNLCDRLDAVYIRGRDSRIFGARKIDIDRGDLSINATPRLDCRPVPLAIYLSPVLHEQKRESDLHVPVSGDFDLIYHGLFFNRHRVLLN
jgi:hypothetical protein